ncbi:hypothetical protein HRbin16_02530 [bacterium HR16]|nr:hypothetical protein HRbin16_02530 [bacterium HR16]
MRTHQTIFAVLSAMLLSSGTVVGDSPLKLRPTLQMPPVIQHPAPLEWIRMYRASERDPSALLRYLDDAYFFEPQGSEDAGNWFLSPLGQEYALFRQYALVRLGDIAGTDLIPVLERYAQMYEAQSKRGKPNNWVYEGFADLARLTIERIRLRAVGRDVYVRAMIEWVRTPIPTPDETLREVDKALMRIRQGARALGVLKAKEAVDVLMGRTKESGPFEDTIACECARALARIGDKRAMQVLREGMMRWMTVYGTYNYQVPLEPGEPDIAWAYWEMRTDGMSTEQAVAELICGLDEHGKMVPGALAGLIRIGKPAEPALLALLKDPSVRSAVKVEVMGVLNGMNSQQAVDIYFDILRRGDRTTLGATAAASLGVLKVREALPDLLKAAEQDDSFVLKEGAIQGLRELGDPAAESLLLRLATQHPDSLVRREAIKALAKAGTPAAIPILEQRLQTEESYLIGYIQNTIDALRKKRQ